METTTLCNCTKCGSQLLPQYRCSKCDGELQVGLSDLLAGKTQELQNCLNKLDEIRKELNRVRNSAILKKENNKHRPLCEATIEADTVIEVVDFILRVLSR